MTLEAEDAIEETYEAVVDRARKAVDAELRALGERWSGLARDAAVAIERARDTLKVLA